MAANLLEKLQRGKLIPQQTTRRQYGEVGREVGMIGMRVVAPPLDKFSRRISDVGHQSVARSLHSGRIINLCVISGSPPGKQSAIIEKTHHQSRGVAQPGSAPALGAGGRRFKSSRPDQKPDLSFQPSASARLWRYRSNQFLSTTMLRHLRRGSAVQLMHAAEVVIIGGGIVGSSIAYHLTTAGCRGVLVIERESAQGKGSTGKSMGGVRAQFSTAVNIQMSLYSIPFYVSFEDRLGHPSGYRPQGYLFCATSDEHMAYLSANYTKQVVMGLKDVRLVTADEIRNMFPQLRSDDIVGGSFCSTDGFVDPYSAMIGFMTWAADHGARIWKNTLVTGIQQDERGIAGLETSKGAVATRIVVNCAGPWAPQVAKMAGIDLPVAPLRRMLVPTEPFDQFPHSAPMIIDMSTGFHFRPESLGFLLAWNDPEETTGYKTDFDRALIEKI